MHLETTNLNEFELTYVINYMLNSIMITKNDKAQDFILFKASRKNDEKTMTHFF